MSGRRIQVVLNRQTIVLILGEEGERLFQEHDGGEAFTDYLLERVLEDYNPEVYYWDEV